MAQRDPLSVAIVGGGVVGAILALGLIDRGIKVQVYEKSAEHSELGVGFAFTGVAQRCMQKLNPAILEALERVGGKNDLARDNYWDGYHHDEDESSSSEGKLLFQLDNSEMDWRMSLRSHFLAAMGDALPKNVVHFGKELNRYEDGRSSSVKLFFADGTTASADVLVGCDGIRSRVRHQMFAHSHPKAARAHFSRKVVYRAVVPMEVAEAALGPTRPHNHCMQTGPGAHMLSYPVAQHTLVNVVTVVDQAGPWSSDGDDSGVTTEKMTRHGSKADLERIFTDWRQEPRAIIANLPDDLVVWAIFDSADHPAPTYAQGCVCLAGDAAHASAPHHGAGAGIGVEDCLALVTALKLAEATAVDRTNSIVAALEAFNDVRYHRSQWLVRSSRETGNIYEWMYPDSGSDPVKIKSELRERQRIIREYDVDAMVAETTKQYHKRLQDVV